jgi:hypothetical protein
MPKPKGGRGYKAPYETHQIRVPDPIANQVHKLIESYQEYINNDGNPNEPPEFISDNKPVNRFIDEIETLRNNNSQLLEKIQDINTNKNKAIDLLKQSLKLKANAGGAIKKEIEKALSLLEVN